MSANPTCNARQLLPNYSTPPGPGTLQATSRELGSLPVRQARFGCGVSPQRGVGLHLERGVGGGRRRESAFIIRPRRSRCTPAARRAAAREGCTESAAPRPGRRRGRPLRGGHGDGSGLGGGEEALHGDGGDGGDRSGLDVGDGTLHAGASEHGGDEGGRRADCTETAGGWEGCTESAAKPAGRRRERPSRAWQRA